MTPQEYASTINAIYVPPGDEGSGGYWAVPGAGDEGGRGRVSDETMSRRAQGLPEGGYSFVGPDGRNYYANGGNWDYWARQLGYEPSQVTAMGPHGEVGILDDLAVQIGQGTSGQPWYNQLAEISPLLMGGAFTGAALSGMLPGAVGAGGAPAASGTSMAGFQSANPFAASSVGGFADPLYGTALGGANAGTVAAGSAGTAATVGGIAAGDALAGTSLAAGAINPFTGLPFNQFVDLANSSPGAASIPFTNVPTGGLPSGTQAPAPVQNGPTNPSTGPGGSVPPAVGLPTTGLPGLPVSGLPGLVAGAGGIGSLISALPNIIGAGSGLNTMFNSTPAVDPNMVNALWQAGQNTYNTSLDPQGDLYRRTQQQLQEQTRAAQAARGISMSPYGAGIENKAMSDFNIDWANQQLNRQVQGAGAFSGAGNVAANAGVANNAQAFMQNQTGLNNLTTALTGTPAGMTYNPATGQWTTAGGNPGLLNQAGSWLSNLWGGGATAAPAAQPAFDMTQFQNPGFAMNFDYGV